METIRNSFKSYFPPDGIIVEPWISNHFVSYINCIEDFDLAKDELTDFRTKILLQLEFNSERLG
jgi:hypothetical protein